MMMIIMIRVPCDVVVAGMVFGITGEEMMDFFEEEVMAEGEEEEEEEGEGVLVAAVVTIITIQEIVEVVVGGDSMAAEL